MYRKWGRILVCKKQFKAAGKESFGKSLGRLKTKLEPVIHQVEMAAYMSLDIDVAEE